MKSVKSITFGLLLSLNLVYSGAALSNSGSIVLRNKDNAICTLTVPSPGKTVDFDLEKTGSGACYANGARSIEFVNVPSATNITLFDYPDCKVNTEDAFQIEMRTTKKQTTSSFIEIEYLTSFNPGDIIEPGLQYLKGFVKQSHTARDNVDCIKVTTSPTPPSP